MYFRRTFRTLIGLVVIAAGLAALPGVAQATALAPFLDLQEKGLTLVGDGEGLVGWGGGPRSLSVGVGGTVRFAFLYWAGRQRPDDDPSGSSVCDPVVVPYRDQQIIFDGTALSGTIIGSECQPASGGGPIHNIGYLADVTSIVAAKGTGIQTFTIADGNPANNLWRFNGATLLVGYINASDTKWYRVLIHHGLDFAFGPDPTPGDTRVTAPVTLNHGANLSDRIAELWLVMGDGTANRPDHVTISNNATLFNEMNSTDGPQWDTEAFDINIPTGVGTTTVQAVSAPNNQNPDSLLWEMVAIRVQQLDVIKPGCPITLNQPGPPARVEVTMKDTGTGLAEVVVTKSENADTVVPPFTVGTNDPVVLSSTKIDQSKRARVEARVTDLAGNVAICDPILTRVEVLHKDDEALDLNTDVPRIEDKVTVTNGSPGVSSLEIWVNGKKFKVKSLKDGEKTTVDISPAMVNGDNVVAFRAKGKKGSWADILIWDGATQ